MSVTCGTQHPDQLDRSCVSARSPPHSVLEMGDDEEEQQYDRFNVDNDFSDGQWIGGEFFHAGRKQKRQQREEDRLYGVFAEGSDSEDEGRRSRRKGGGGGGDRGTADYSAPVGFVSSGVVNKQQPEEEAVATAPQGAYDVQGPPGLGSGGGGQQGGAGLGAGRGSGGGGGGGGLGFRSAGAQNGSGDADMEQRRKEEEEGDEEEGVLGTALGARCVFRAWGGWAHGECVCVCLGCMGCMIWWMHARGLHGGLWGWRKVCVWVAWRFMGMAGGSQCHPCGLRIHAWTMQSAVAMQNAVVPPCSPQLPCSMLSCRHASCCCAAMQHAVLAAMQPAAAIVPYRT